MNLTLHLVRKDLWRLRWWLFGWVALLLMPIALGAGLLAKNPFTTEEWPLHNVLEWIYALEVLAAYLLTILLLQDDAVIGTQQFWLTRPISRGRLLTAKLLGVFVVLALIPIAVSLPWWWWHGFGVVQMAEPALEIVLLAMLVAIPAAFIGALTETLARAVLWTMVLAAAVLTSLAFFPRFGGVIPGMAAALVCMVVVTVRVFFTRRRAWSLLLLGALAWPVFMGGAMLLATRFSRDQTPREHHAEQGDKITVKFERAETDAGEPVAGRRNRVQWVRSVYSVEGARPETALFAVGGTQVFRWPGIERSEVGHPTWNPVRWHTSPLATLGLRPPSADPETEQWRAVDRARRSGGGQASQSAVSARDLERHFELYAYLPPSLVARMQIDPPSFQATTWLRLARPEILYELELRPGQHVRRHGISARIEHVQPGANAREGTAHVTFVESSQAPWWREIHGAIGSRQWQAHHQPFSLLAVNRGRGEYGESVRPDKSRAVVVNGVRIAWHAAYIHPGWVRRGDRWVGRPGWMDGTAIALLRFREEALFKREVNVERFPVENLRARASAGR